jgi:hypothetical protein
MLSSVLNSERAVQVNIAIMRTFVQLRRLMDSNADLARKIESLEKKYDENSLLSSPQSRNSSLRLRHSRKRSDFIRKTSDSPKKKPKQSVFYFRDPISELSLLPDFRKIAS